MTAGFGTSGGEGGIRTPGTGVSPYKGLANEIVLAALTRFQALTVVGEPSMSGLSPSHLAFIVLRFVLHSFFAENAAMLCLG